MDKSENSTWTRSTWLIRLFLNGVWECDTGEYWDRAEAEDAIASRTTKPNEVRVPIKVTTTEVVEYDADNCSPITQHSASGGSPMSPTHIAAIIEKASAASGVTIEEIMGPLRHLRVARVRFAIWHTLRASGMTYHEIGKSFKLHHSAIQHGVQQATLYLEFPALCKSLSAEN